MLTLLNILHWLFVCVVAHATASDAYKSITLTKDMKSLPTVAAATVAPPTTASDLGPDIQRRVMYGATARRGQFPYQVSLFDRATQQHLCGGALIDAQRILTAAHCVTSPHNAVRAAALYGVQFGTNVRIGTERSRSGGGGLVRSVGRIDVHPLWRYERGAYDFAVLTLCEPLDLAASHRRIGVIRLAEPARWPLDRPSETGDGSCIVSGWGKTETTEAPVQLQYANVNLVASDECARRTAMPIGADRVCALGRQKQDSARGDSGGPLACDGQLVGLVSFGLTGAEAGDVPAVYARVSTVLDWIAEVRRAPKPMRASAAPSDGGQDCEPNRRRGRWWSGTSKGCNRRRWWNRSGNRNGAGARSADSGMVVLMVMSLAIMNVWSN